jgi:Holliday junction resolvasome RuvABC endonuclease subunit
MEDLQPSVVLSVAPGTRSLGIAVFDGLDLIYYGVKESSKHRSLHTPHSRAREATAAVESLMHKYQPGSLALASLASVQRLSPKLSLLADHLERLARHRGIAVSKYESHAVRRAFYTEGRATKQAVATKLSALYPELKRFASGVSVWQRLYYARMFTAVAAGYLYACEMQRQCEKAALVADDNNSMPRAK